MDVALWEYRYIIIFIALIIVCYLFEWQRTKTVLYALMLKAKKTSEKDGILKSEEEQENWVIKKAWIYLPFIVKMFLNENLLRSVIHELYDSLKNFTNENNMDEII